MSPLSVRLTGRRQRAGCNSSTRPAPRAGRESPRLLPPFPTSLMCCRSIREPKPSRPGTANANLGVTIGTNFVFFPETAGNHANLGWTERRIAFTANSNFTTVSFQDDTGFDANDSYGGQCGGGAAGLWRGVGSGDGFQRPLPNRCWTGNLSSRRQRLAAPRLQPRGQSGASRSPTRMAQPTLSPRLSAASSSPFPPRSVPPARAPSRAAERSRKTAR